MQTLKETMGEICAQWKSALGVTRSFGFPWQAVTIWPLWTTHGQGSHGTSILL